MSNVRKLFSVNAIILASLAIGFLNNVAIGGFFGLNRVIDAYFASSILGQMFMYLIVDYVGKNFLPIYAKRFHDSPEDAGRLASVVVTLFALLAAVVVLLLLAFAKPIFTFLLPGFDEADIAVTTKMFAIQAPAIVLMTVNNFHQYVWQHDEKYNRVVFARMFLPLSLLFFIVGGYLFGDAYALAMGFLAGHCVSAIVLAYRLPYRFRPRIEFRNADVRKVLSNSAMLSTSGLIARLRAPIMQYYGSLLGEGAIAAMNMAMKLCRPINQSAMLGIQMIAFSRSARQVAKGNIDKLADIYDYAISAVLLGTMPIAVWITFNARQLVEVIYMRGELTASMATLIALALTGAAASIVFRGLVKLLSESFYAMHRIIIPIVIMPLGTVVFFVATKYLSETYGIFGLTAANSLVSTLTTIVMAICLAYYLPQFSASTIFRRIFMYLALAAFGGYAGIELSAYAGADGWLRLAVSFAAMMPIYAGVLWLARESVFLRILRSLAKAVSGDKEKPATS